jgi:hypothetical protein
MSDGGLRVIGAEPAGPGFRRAFLARAQAPCAATAFDDARLASLRRMLDDDWDPEIEILPFGELLGRILSLAGLPAAVLAPRGAIESLIRRLLETDEGAFGPWSAWQSRSGGWRALAGAFEDLRRSGFTADSLRSAAGSLDSDEAEEAEGLAALMQSLDRALDEMGMETAADRIQRLMAAPLPSCPALRRVVAAAGGEDRPLYHRFLAWLADSGVRVDLIVEGGAWGSDAWGASSRLRSRLGLDPEPPDPSPEWRRRIFSDPGGSIDAPRLAAWSASDRLAEAEAALREAYAAQREGVAPHRMVLFCRDSAAAGPAIELASQRLGLPISMHRQAPLLANGFARSALALLKAMSAASPGPLIDWAQAGYGPAEEGEALRERAAFASRAADPWDALEGAAPESDWLQGLAAWRREAMEAADLAAWRARLRRLAGEAGMTAPLGEGIEAERDQGAFQALQRSLALAAAAPPSLVRPACSLAEFAAFAEEAWSRAVYTVESGRSGIRVASDPAQIIECDWLWIMGLSEGSFPRRRSEEPVLRDRLVAALNAHGGGWLPDSGDRAQAEREEFLRLCSTGARQLHFSLEESGMEKEAQAPAFYVQAAFRAAGLEPDFTRISAGEFSPADPERRLPKEEPLAQALASGPEPWPEPGLSDEAARSRARIEPGRPFPIRLIAAAEQCPFRASAEGPLGWRAPADGDLARLARGLLRRIGASGLASAEAIRDRLREEVERTRAAQGPELDEVGLALFEAAARESGEALIQNEIAARIVLGRKPEDARPGADPGLLGRSADFKVRRRGKMAVSFPGAEFYISEGLAGAILHRSSASFARVRSDVAEQQDLEILCTLAALAFKNQPARIEVDVAGGQRWVVVLHLPGNPAIAPRRAPGLPPIKIHRMSFASESAAYRSAGDRAELAADALEEGAMIPKPSEACRSCRWGEICRRSAVFSEADE